MVSLTDPVGSRHGRLAITKDRSLRNEILAFVATVSIKQPLQHRQRQSGVIVGVIFGFRYVAVEQGRGTGSSYRERGCW